jgi:hypothetical protein
MCIVGLGVNFQEELEFMQCLHVLYIYIWSYVQILLKVKIFNSCIYIKKITVSWNYNSNINAHKLKWICLPINIITSERDKLNRRHIIAIICERAIIEGEYIYIVLYAMKFILK